MARLPRVPSYRRHKPSGQARIIVAGKHIYLGKFNTPESLEKYHRLVADLVSGSPVVLSPDQAASPLSAISVNQLILAYLQFAKVTYVKNGRPTDEQASLRSAFRRLRKVNGNMLAGNFGPKALKYLQRSMIAEGLSRKYINDSINRIRRLFKWGTSEELVPVAVYQALRTVDGLSAH